MNDIEVCVSGWVGTEPDRIVVSNGDSYARFRVGSTPRIHDRATGTFRDGDTQWFTVKAWRELGENVVASVSKGDPVVLRGILRTESWVGENGERSEKVITVNAVGHDLKHGTSKYTRTIRTTAEAGEDGGQDGAPEVGEGSVQGALTGPDGVRYDVEELEEAKSDAVPV